MEDKELQLVDHLDELRKRIIISQLGLLFFLLLGSFM
jgi:sec-independent protein translocase protein TatC